MEKIYSFNAENGIKHEGISSYCGGHICSQLGYAMYINVWGEVFDCPASKHKLGNIKSSFSNITCGVPQGSILWPLLFSVYINDMNRSIKFPKPPFC